MIDRLHSYGKEVSTWRVNLSLITRGAAVIDPYRNTYHIYIYKTKMRKRLWTAVSQSALNIKNSLLFLFFQSYVKE